MGMILDSTDRVMKNQKIPKERTLQRFLARQAKTRSPRRKRKARGVNPEKKPSLKGYMGSMFWPTGRKKRRR